MNKKNLGAQDMFDPDDKISGGQGLEFSPINE